MASQSYSPMLLCIYTDHKPLIHAFHTVSWETSSAAKPTFLYIALLPRLYIDGKQNLVTDTRSRIETIQLNQDYTALCESQHSDAEFAYIRNGYSLKLDPSLIPGTNITIYCDISIRKPRLYLTPNYWHPAFQLLHNLSHPGALATVPFVADRFVWPGIAKDCQTWARECEACQRRRSHAIFLLQLRIFLHLLVVNHIHVDIKGPLSPSNGYSYCCTLIDHFSKWPGAWPRRFMLEEEVAVNLVSGLFLRFGYSCYIHIWPGTSVWINTVSKADEPWCYYMQEVHEL